MDDPSKPAPESADAWDATQWYEVKKGDTLSKIAKEFYGDRRCTRRSSKPTRIA